MRLVLISDTHGLHDKINNMPEGDVLIHAGDFMNSGTDLREIISFNRWLGQQSFKHRVVCAGNHDKYFEFDPGTAKGLLTNADYLENSEVTIEGVRLAVHSGVPKLGLHVSSRNCCDEILGQHSRTSRCADRTWAAVRSP
jgi:predicted phosphodiesterase